MNRLRPLYALLAAIAFVLPAAPSQPPAVKPGKEHEVLKRFEGPWDIVSGTETNGTVTYKMELGGLWLTGTFQYGDTGTQPSARQLTTFDPIKKKYVTVFVDSTSSRPWISEGTFDEAGNVCTMIGEGPGPDGKPTKQKWILEFKDKDTIVETNYAPDNEGKEQAAGTVTYKRRK
jgi:hypothetical protein